MNDLIPVFLLLGFVVLLWMQGMRARESAMRLARAACARNRVELLDQTVAQSRARPARAASGRVVLRRTYSFEFSTNGYDRHQGYLELLGGRPDGPVRLELPDGWVIEPDAPAQRLDNVVSFQPRGDRPA